MAIRFSLAVLVLALSASSLQAADFYISTSGNDSNPGTLSQPFRTLEKARDTIRSLKSSSGLPAGGVTIHLRGGNHLRTDSFSLSSQDSGTSDRPIVYRSYGSETARLIGGIQIPSSWFSLVPSSASSYTRLPSIARGNVYWANLGSHGITNYGTLKARGYNSFYNSAMEVFFNGDAPELARWPNTGYVRTVSVPNGQYGRVFTYSGSQADRWTQATDVWLMGYWYNLYAENFCRMANLNTGSKAITLEQNPAYGLGTDQPYFVLNLLEELDRPGEYYIDRA
ncbi:hypothetical protein HQ520_02475, partial [bacterium]|nr:hypothetical protein [bacterium]